MRLEAVDFADVTFPESPVYAKRPLLALTALGRGYLSRVLRGWN